MQQPTEVKIKYKWIWNIPKIPPMCLSLIPNILLCIFQINMNDFDKIEQTNEVTIEYKWIYNRII